MTTKKNNPLISIIIPTYSKSVDVLEIPLRSIALQSCKPNLVEVIIADNRGGKKIKKIAERYGVKFIEINFKPPQISTQRIAAAKIAKGKYLFYLDHDIELSKDLIKNFFNLIKINNNKNIDAWYIPYKIIARSKILTTVRNFEEIFYKNSVVAAARIIKAQTYRSVGGFDPTINCGPADWDLDVLLMEHRAKFAYIKDYVYHHEEDLTFWEFVTKKTIYSVDGEYYINKWKKRNIKLYKNIVSKQYSLFYRMVTIFIENGKWRLLLPKFHLFILFLITKTAIVGIYTFFLIIHILLKNTRHA
jgi:glycosyltransferase involved in cell wall biosynthesis